MNNPSTTVSETTTTTGAVTVDICGVSGFGNNSAGVYRARVAAREQGVDQSRCWDVSFAWRKNSTGTLAIQGNLTTVLDQGTVGAVLWSVQAVAVSGVLYLRVKGDSGSTVNWGAHGDCEWLEQ